MMRNALTRIEARVERLVEGTLTRWFAARLQPREVLIQLARAMEDQARADGSGLMFAPTHFIVRMHTAEAPLLADADPRAVVELQNGLVELAREAGLRMRKSPTVVVQSDPSLPPRGLIVEAHHESEEDTRSITPVSPTTHTPACLPPASLIVDGGRHVLLDRPVTNIGRRLDNQIILDDPRVSRAHAQIRLRHGRFVLYDLGSQLGTRVNDRQVTEWTLRAGDVITIAGIPLIYVEEDSDTPAAPTSDFTQPMPPGKTGGAGPARA